MDLKLESEYKTGLIAATDLHAGGLFFCIVYRKILRFSANAEVNLYNQVINPLAPMDPQDVRHLERSNLKGTYFFNERGYLKCDFPTMKIELTGRITGEDHQILAFHQYDRHTAQNSSVVFTLE